MMAKVLLVKTWQNILVNLFKRMMGENMQVNRDEKLNYSTTIFDDDNLHSFE